MNDNFINVRQLVPQLLKFKADYPDKKIAFCFSGGGARGAYFGGIIEAIQQEINKHPQQSLLPLAERWKPDIICGSSAGAIAGFSYWLDCLLPSNPTPYACRQSKVWRDISDGNKGGEKLFSNSSVIDFLSGSSGELDAFLDSIEKLQVDIRLISDDISKWWTDIKLVISESAGFDINRLRDNVSSRVDDIKNRAEGLLSFKIKDISSYANNACSLIKDVHTIGPELMSDIAGMQIDQAKNLIDHIQRLNNDIKQGNKDIGKALRDIKDTLNKFQDLFKKIIATLKQTLKSIKDNSSLMNTEGLQSVLETYIYNSFPAATFPTVNGKIDARELDKAVIKLVKNKWDAGQKIPALFVTGTNINAKRCVAFSLAPFDLNERVATRNLWVIKLDEEGTDMVSHKGGGKPNEFVFGGKRFGADYSHTADIKLPPVIFGPQNANQPTQFHVDTNFVSTTAGTEQSPTKQGVATSAIPVKKMGGINLMNTSSQGQSPSININTLGANLTNPATDFTKGRSLFVGAILTSATIPIAFPPRQWTFFTRPPEQVKFTHWMVDGGIVNNRPIDVAEKAGAEFIISFELTPLLSATTEMKKEVTEYPKFTEVIGRSMIDATLNAGFYKYFEDLVTQNAGVIPPAKPRLTLYRMAPMMYNVTDDVDFGNGPFWDDHTPGTYDFNGTYDKDRNFRMGLFDWFMKGYIDAKGGDNIDMNDPVNSAYTALPASFGAKKNAYSGRRSGFYDASIKAHPDTSPPW